MNGDTSDTIRELLLKGISYQVIADSVGLSKGRIGQLANSMGLAGKGWEIRKTNRGETDDFLIDCRIKYQSKKSGVLMTGRVFTVEFSDIYWDTKCPIFGFELDYYSATRKDNSPSLICKDVELGYVTGNVSIVSWRACRIIGDSTLQELSAVVNYMCHTL